MAFDANDIVGKRFGQLTVEALARKERNKKYKHNKYFYECLCDCGTLKEAVRTNLITGHTTSCGCLKQRRGKANPCWNGCGEISGRFWTHIKRHASSRGLVLEVTIEQAWKQFLAQERKCALSGLPLIIAKTKIEGQYTKRTASLDRRDSTKGYIPENVQWVHKDINKMKMNMDENRFIELCSLVAGNRGSLC